jgi:hypothetical protein
LGRNRRITLHLKTGGEDMKVSDILAYKDKKVLIKLKNIFYKNNGNTFLDAFLIYFKENDDWRIGLKAEGNKENRKEGEKAENIMLSLSQIEYLITKMQLLDSVAAKNEKFEMHFGIENGEGIRKIVGKNHKGEDQIKYFKFLVEYGSHKKNGEKEEKATYPMNVLVKNMKIDFL